MDLRALLSGKRSSFDEVRKRHGSCHWSLYSGSVRGRRDGGMDAEDGMNLYAVFTDIAFL